MLHDFIILYNLIVFPYACARSSLAIHQMKNPGCFHFLPIVNGMTVNIAKQVPVAKDATSFGHTPRSAIPSNVVLPFLRILHTDSHTGFWNFQIDKTFLIVPLFNVDNLEIRNSNLSGIEPS